MLKKISIFLLLLFLMMNFYGQEEKVLKIVEVPDSVRTKLILFLSNAERLGDTQDRALYIFNLQEPKDLKFKDGIYAFRLVGPHFYRRIFIVTGNDITIFGSRFVDSLLQEFLTYLKHSNLPELKRIQYLKVMSYFLEEEFIQERS
jgi:hypothetical protein